MAEAIIPETQILNQCKKDVAQLNDEQQHKITLLKNQHEYDLIKDK